MLTLNKYDQRVLLSLADGVPVHAVLLAERTGIEIDIVVTSLTWLAQAKLVEVIKTSNPEELIVRGITPYQLGEYRLQLGAQAHFAL